MTAHRIGWLVVIGLALPACGDEGTAKPIAQVEMRDLRAEQARERAPAQVLRGMRMPEQPDRVIYDPPPDLTLRTPDSLLTAPLGITPGAAAPRAGADTSGARRGTAARGDTARRDSVRRP